MELNNKTNIYVSKWHINKNDKKIVDFNERVEKIKQALTPSKSDNYRKDLIVAKKINKKSMNINDFFFVIKLIMLKNLYTIDYLQKTQEIKNDFFAIKKTENLMSIQMVENQKVKIKVLDKDKIIRTEITKGMFGRWIYKVHVTFEKPLLISTLKGLTYKRDIVNQLKKDLKIQVNKINNGIKESLNKTTEEIIKIDFNNLK
ncbi:hypothetical protein [Spiroplasma endosymbiont of Crioceris asparagi]|uniref:hypothetical protein n=1 Tax=Spiroplasma endosymbiont of Crioceris asparagi TaxID=3066286 RepID=UPI0030CB4CB1